MRKILLAALVLLAVPASANAATTIVVNDQTDAKLESGATACESEDGGKCTLRAAVELADHASAEATIELPEGTYAESLSPATLVVEDGARISIVGAGRSLTTIEGDEDGSVLSVEVGGSLTLEGVTVKDGDGSRGGGAFVEYDGSLRVRSSTFSENHADYQGGGVYAEPRSAVVVEESTFAKNSSTSDGAGLYEASGAVCFTADAAHAATGAPLQAPLDEGLTIVRSSIEGNVAEEGEGGGIAAVAAGGCAGTAARHQATRPTVDLLDEEEGRILVEQSTIAHNEAKPEEDGYYGGYGGGVYVEGEIYDPIVDSTIADNYATYEGGGVDVWTGEESLVSDTVAYNTIEPEERETARPSDVQNAAGPYGANLATQELEDGPWGTIYLRNTIVAEEAGSEADNCSGDVESLDEGSGYNLDFPSTPIDGPYDSCGMSEADKDLVGVDPKLDPKGLQGNGGPTQTIALTAESPAIGQVPVEGDCEQAGTGPALELEAGKHSSVDQRSEPRPGIAGKGCDIGAYEYQEPTKETKKEETEKEESKPAAKTEVLSVKITSPAACTSKRDIVIHIQNVKQFGVVSAVVSIDGKARRTLRGKHLRTGIDLVGLPKGTFTVSIVAKTRSGKTLHGQRVYHTCHTKLPGHLRLRL